MASPTTQHQIRNAPYSSASFDAWHSRHKKAPFSPAWNPLLIAWMADDCETSPARNLAWLILRASGNFSDRPRDEFGTELFRADCARETGQSPQRVSEGMEILNSRGIVDFSGRSLILRDDPSDPIHKVSGPPGQHSLSSGQFKAFKKQYLSDNPQAAQSLAEAQALIKATELQILKAYQANHPPPAQNPPTICPDLPDKSVRTSRTSCPDLPDKNGRILRTVEVPENTDIEATAAAAAGAATTALTVIEREPGDRGQQQQPSRSQFMLGGPDPNGWRPVEDLLQSMEPTANPDRIRTLISDCRKARAGLSPGILTDLIAKWPIGPAVHSPIAILSKDLPSILSDSGRLNAFMLGPPVRFGSQSKAAAAADENMNFYRRAIERARERDRRDPRKAAT